MARRSTRIWIGLGAMGLGMAIGGPEGFAQHTGHKAEPGAGQGIAGPAPPHGTGQLAAPQGGEAYLTDGGPKDTRVRIYRDIALMRGHLLVGAELVELGRWDEALPHFLHPTEELYGQMERYIKLHNVTPFDRQLKALAQAVKARRKPAYLESSKVVEARLSNALQSFRKFMTGSPFTSFTAQAVAEVMKVVKLEYEASIENGLFSKPVEYQDSRGFLLIAKRLLERHRKELEAIDRTRYNELRQGLTELKTVWPSPVPPEKPVQDAATVSAKVDRLVATAERFF